MSSSTIYLFLILGSIVLIIIVANSASNRQKTYKTLEQKEAEERAQKASEERARQNAERRQKIAKQKELEDCYAASPLTWQIICAISGSTNHRPEIIEVYDDHVTGRTNGVMRTYDFYVNRVEPFTAVYEVASGRDIDIKTILRPQMALGAAINRQLGGEYDLVDKGRWSREPHRYSDGELYYVIEYTSDHVRLTLRANNRF